MHCDHCEMIAINGVACHEQGCPRTPRQCRECGEMFEPDGHLQLCEGCREDMDEGW